MQLSRAGRRGVSLANDREVGPRRKASGRNRGFRNVAACDYVGIVSGNNTPDKMEKSGLTAEKSAVVDAPLFTQLPLTLECKYVHSTEEGNIIGEIVNISVDERILGADGKIDMTKFRPISYEPVHNGYHVLGERVGTAFSDGMKLK